MTVELNLTVNDEPINTDYFVSGFIDHTVSGMIEALEHTGKIKELNLSLDSDKVTINLNGTIVPVNEFVNKIVKSTILGLVTPLKGVSGIKKLNILLRK